MKRSLMLVLCIVLVVALAIPAFAAGNVSYSMSPSKTVLGAGEQFTVSISLNSSVAVQSYGFQFVYDKNVFEMTGGTVTATGAAVATCAYSSVSGTYAYGCMFMPANAYSGSYGTATFKVKDNAAPGTYTFSAAPSVPGESPTCNTFTITVCDHQYGSFTNLNDTQHQGTCTKCGKTNNIDHKWNSGEVTKKATCKEDGEKTYTCSDCKATKTEKIDKSTVAHTYGAWTKVSDTKHEHTCSVCEKKEQADHKWDDGQETKKPTCKEEGETTFTCSDCKATKTEKIDKLTTHTYGAWTKLSDTEHEHTCSVCEKKEQADHTWDAGTVTKKATCKEEGEKTFTCKDCGATKVEKLDKLTTHTFGKWEKVDAENHKRVCTVCEKEESAAHAYKTSWSKDSAEHWHECSDCKDKKDVEKHTPGAAATETTAQTCTVCKYIIKAALGHKHNYATEWTTDETGHWYKCSGCEEKGQFAEHDFENVCDPDCSICAYTREAGHTFTDEWASDAENHWHECTGCGLKEEEAAHIAGPEATETSAQECTICKYELAPQLNTEEPEEAPAVGTDVEEQKPADNSTLMKILFIVLALAVVGGIVAAVVIGKKKK